MAAAIPIPATPTQCYTLLHQFDASGRGLFDKLVRDAEARYKAANASPAEARKVLRGALQGLILPILARMQIDVRDLPQAIHIAGSKGKGTVCSFATEMLVKRGKRVLTFVSPSLVSPAERILVNGRPITDDQYVACFRRVQEALYPTASTLHSQTSLPMNIFTFWLLMALETAVRERVDVIVLETGIGGLMDSTNFYPVERVAATGITFLELEHTDMLGHTIEEIAFQKAGIFREGIAAISVPQHKEAMKVLRACAPAAGDGGPADLQVADAPIVPNDIQLAAQGAHHRDNAALAVRLVQAYFRKTDASAVIPGEASLLAAVKDVNVPGRSQVIRWRPAVAAGSAPPPPKLILYVDGAHTAASAVKAARWFNEACARSSALLTNTSSAASGARGPASMPMPLPSHQRKRVLIFNCGRDKDVVSMISTMLALQFDSIYITALGAAPPRNSNESTLPPLTTATVMQHFKQRHIESGTASMLEMLGNIFSVPNSWQEYEQRAMADWSVYKASIPRDAWDSESEPESAIPWPHMVASLFVHIRKDPAFEHARRHAAGQVLGSSSGDEGSVSSSPAPSLGHASTSAGSSGIGSGIVHTPSPRVFDFTSAEKAHLDQRHEPVMPFRRVLEAIAAEHAVYSGGSGTAASSSSSALERSGSGSGHQLDADTDMGGVSVDVLVTGSFSIVGAAFKATGTPVYPPRGD